MKKCDAATLTIINRACHESDDAMSRDDYPHLEVVKHRLLLNVVRGIADGSIGTAQTSCREILKVYREINAHIKFRQQKNK